MKLKHGVVWNLETLMESLKLEIETRECVQTKGSFKESANLDTRKPGYGKTLRYPKLLQLCWVEIAHQIAPFVEKNTLPLIVTW